MVAIVIKKTPSFQLTFVTLNPFFLKFLQYSGADPNSIQTLLGGVSVREVVVESGDVPVTTLQCSGAVCSFHLRWQRCLFLKIAGFQKSLQRCLKAFPRNLSLMNQIDHE